MGKLKGANKTQPQQKLVLLHCTTVQSKTLLGLKYNQGILNVFHTAHQCQFSLGSHVKCPHIVGQTVCEMTVAHAHRWTSGKLWGSQFLRPYIPLDGASGSVTATQFEGN